MVSTILWQVVARNAFCWLSVLVKVNHRNADAQAGRAGEGNEPIPQTASKGKSKAD